MKAKCRHCHFEAHPKEFETCLSPYHDLRCPECRTTDVDTSELNQEITHYCYGDGNFLKM